MLSLRESDSPMKAGHSGYVNADTGLLQRLIGSTGVDLFLREYWEKKHLFVPGVNTTAFADLLPISAVDDYLSRNDIRYPSISLVKYGQSIPAAAYTRILRIGAYKSEGLIDTDSVLREYLNGATIILQLMQNSFPSVADLAVELGLYFRCRVDVHAFLTPNTFHGLKAHYDTASAFLIQVSGAKRWRLFDSQIEAPASDQTFEPSKPIDTAPIDEFVMNAGDVLYLPRGLPHEGVALDSSSTHLTVVLFPQTWIDIMLAALSRCESDVDFRVAPSGLVGTNSPALTTLEDTWLRLFSKLSENVVRHQSIRESTAEIKIAQERKKRWSQSFINRDVS